MTLLSDLIGQHTISLDNAERTGTVKGIVLDRNRIVAIDLGDDLAVAATSVRTFEGDVLTYEGDTVSAGEDQSINPIGYRVLDITGNEVGTIADLDISAVGDIETIILHSGDHLDGDRLRAIGTYAAIITTDLPTPTEPNAES
jgi:sporulation protein YlmC with PRC-barrel domain